MLLMVRGEVRSVASRGPEISVKTFEIVATPEEAERGEAGAVLGLAPIYHASSKISSRSLRDMAGVALQGAARIGDPLPPSLRVRTGCRCAATRSSPATVPRTVDDHRVARDRLAYEELLLLQVALLRHRAAVAAAGRAEALAPPGDLVARYIARPALRPHRRAGAGRWPRSAPTWAPPSRCSACCRATSGRARRRWRWPCCCGRSRRAARPR